MAEDRESIKRTEASVTRFDSEFHAWPKEYPPMPRNELPKHLTNMAAKHCGTTPYCDVSPIVRIFESEICAMARSAVEWGEKETGGGLYGAYTGDNRITVLLATPPGPNAQHGHGRFCQDIGFVRQADGMMVRDFGQRNAGRYHSHTGADSRLPSRHDNDTAASTIRKNGFPVYLEFLFVPSAHNSGHVKLCPFAYIGSSDPKLVQCKVRILPGCSPVRERLCGSTVFSSSDSYAWWFPLKKVTIVGQDRDGLKIPQRLLAQILALPTHVRRKAELMQKGDVVLVTLPVGDQHTAVFGYRLSEISQPIAVQVRATTGQETDFTHRFSVRKGTASLADTFAQLENMIRTLEKPAVDAWDRSATPLDSRDLCGNFASHAPRVIEKPTDRAPQRVDGLSVRRCCEETSQVSPEESSRQTTLPMERE